MYQIQNFFKNKRILITGHTGFKGSWLSIWLHLLGSRVIGIALDPVYEKDLFILTGLEKKIIDYREDIRNSEKIQKLLNKEQPDIVFHLAAQALVIPSYKKPVSTFETNIMGTVNLLEACRHTPSVKQVIIVTTDKVYDNKESLTGYMETDPLGGYDPYSASKAAAEIVAQSYRLSFSDLSDHLMAQSISTARAGNVIGGGDWSEYRLVPDCIRSLEAIKPIVIRNPNALRPWQHVLEPLAGYLLLALRMSENPIKYSGAWNFGPDEKDNASVKDFVDFLITLWGSGQWETDNEGMKFHEAGLLRLNIDKSKDLLGWKPVLDFRDAVQWTVEWYKAYEGNNVFKLCVDQIEKFMLKWNS